MSMQPGRSTDGAAPSVRSGAGPATASDADPGTGTGTGTGTGSGQPAAGKDWEWRRKIRANPATYRVYRIAVAIAGFVIVVGGIFLLPLPGPGWVIIFLGLGIWGSEFAWAQRLLRWAKDKVREWTAWTARQSPVVKAVLGLATAVVVLAVVYGYLKWQGAPHLLPDGIESWLTRTFDLPD